MLRDVWTSGDAYELYVGRWSRRVAEELLHWLNVPPGTRWLDVGCGTGALTAVILELASPAFVRAYDSSAGYIDYARRQIVDHRVQFELGDAHALPEQPASYDAIVSGLVLNFLSDPARAVTEMVRLVRPDGKIGVYVWDYAGQTQFMRYFWDAAIATDPAAVEFDEGRRFPLCQPEPLEELFRRVGLENVEVGAIDVVTQFLDFEDYWNPFLGGQGPAPGYVKSLPEQQRLLLREQIRSRLPVDDDGKISLIARAWAVRAVA